MQKLFQYIITHSCSTRTYNFNLRVMTEDNNEGFV